MDLNPSYSERDILGYGALSVKGKRQLAALDALGRRALVALLRVSALNLAGGTGREGASNMTTGRRRHSAASPEKHATRALSCLATSDFWLGGGVNRSEAERGAGPLLPVRVAGTMIAFRARRRAANEYLC